MAPRRKAAAARLRGSASRDGSLSSLTRLTADWYWEQDTRHRVTYMSRNIADKTGAPLKAFVGRTRWEEPALNLTEVDWARHRAQLERRETFRDFEIHRRCADGREVWLSVSGEPLFDARGRFRGYRGVGQDITERKRAEDDMRRFRLAMDSSADMILLVDRATMRYVDVNHTTCRLLGYSRDELLAKGPADLVPEPLGEIERAYDALIANPSVSSGMASTFLCKDGQRLPFESNRQVHRSAERWIIVVIARDIRERRRADQALRESEARFRSLTDLSSDWYWEQDAEYRFIRIEGRQVAGGSAALRKRLLGARRWETGLECEGGWHAHLELLEARKPFFDLLMWRPDDEGRIRYLRVSGEPIFDAEGRFAGYRGVGRNITAEKRAEQLLRLEHQIASALSEAEDERAGVLAVLRALCELEGLACGRCFFADEAQGVLRFMDGWCSDPAFRKFVEASRAVTYRPGQGLAGRVWHTGEPIWSADTVADPRVQEKTLSRASGTRAGFVFAVTSEGRRIGVISISSREVRPPDERLLQALRVIGGQLGQFLQRKRAEEALRQNEARFRSLTQMSSDFFWETDAEHRVTDIAHGEKIAAGLLAGALGKQSWQIPSISPDEAAWAAHRATLDRHEPFREFEFARRMSDGSVRHFSVSGDPCFARDGAFTGYRGVGRDITETVLARQHISSLAYTDPLTGLANRTSLGPAFEQAIERARRRGDRLATLFVDLDGFKQANDLHGHAAGDRFLAEIARRLRASLRASDIVARIGGDEFFIVLEDPLEAQAVDTVSRKLLAEVLRPYEVAPGAEVRVSASIGISIFPDDAHDAATLMSHADRAMYEAKQAGKNAFRYYAELAAQSAAVRSPSGTTVG